MRALKNKDLPRMDQDVLLTFSTPMSNPHTMKVLQPAHSDQFRLSRGPPTSHQMRPVVPPPPRGYITSSTVPPPGSGMVGAAGMHNTRYQQDHRSESSQSWTNSSRYPQSHRYESQPGLDRDQDCEHVLPPPPPAVSPKSRSALPHPLAYESSTLQQSRSPAAWRGVPPTSYSESSIPPSLQGIPPQAGEDHGHSPCGAGPGPYGQYNQGVPYKSAQMQPPSPPQQFSFKGLAPPNLWPFTAALQAPPQPMYGQPCSGDVGARSGNVRAASGLQERSSSPTVWE